MTDWHDTDGDGVGNVGTSDTNRDGVIDQYTFDTDGNHVIDGFGVDTNQDGIVDVAYLDDNEDGRVEAYAADEDHDGTADSFGVDPERDGVFVAPGIPEYSGPVEYVHQPAVTNEDVANQILIDQLNRDALNSIDASQTRIQENMFDQDIDGDGDVGWSVDNISD